MQKLGDDKGVEVSFAFARHGMDTGAFIVDHKTEILERKILGVLWDAIHAHGIPIHEQPRCHADHELLPRRDYSTTHQSAALPGAGRAA